MSWCGLHGDYPTTVCPSCFLAPATYQPTYTYPSSQPDGFVTAADNDENDCKRPVRVVTETVISKPSNPKDLIGTDKAPLSLVPAVALIWQSVAHLEGHLKYGLVNWREAGVRASIYLDALERHAKKFTEGEWADMKTQVPHLASIGACCNIILDAYYAGKLIDDRPKSNDGAFTAFEEAERVVKNLRELHKDKNPTHYTIEGPR